MTAPLGPLAGVDAGATHTTPQFQVGTQSTHNSGGLYMYVQAAAAISNNDVVSIQSSTTGAVSARPINKNNILSDGLMGVSDGGNTASAGYGAIASGSYGWVKISGAGIGNVAHLAAKSVALYTTAVDGYIGSSASAAGTAFQKLGGVTIVSSAGASDSTGTIQLAYGFAAL